MPGLHICGPVSHINQMYGDCRWSTEVDERETAEDVLQNFEPAADYVAHLPPQKRRSPPKQSKNLSGKLTELDGDADSDAGRDNDSDVLEGQEGDNNVVRMSGLCRERQNRRSHCWELPNSSRV